MALWFTGTPFGKAAATTITTNPDTRWDERDAREAEPIAGRWGAAARRVSRSEARLYRSAKIEHELAYGDYLHD